MWKPFPSGLPNIRCTSSIIVQTLQNACKALDHGAFFGPDACVVFDAISLNISGDRFYQSGDLNAAIDEYHFALTLDDDQYQCAQQPGRLPGGKG